MFLNRSAAFPIILILIFQGCAGNKINVVDESSEGLLRAIDFSRVNYKNLDKNQFEEDKSTCAIAASTADTDGNDLANIGAASVGAAAGAASLPATATAAAGPIAILSVGIVYGIQKVASRNNAAPLKALILESCLKEKGYEVQIKQINNQVESNKNSGIETDEEGKNESSIPSKDKPKKKRKPWPAG
tara:strand:+ start:255 stop:818 length:564 start_codon:yes stop_codon:yes gene_type:complete